MKEKMQKVNEEYILTTGEVIKRDKSYKNKAVRALINNLNNENLYFDVVSSTNSKLGFDFRTMYGLESNFNLPPNNTLIETFKKVSAQTCALPFSDEEFKNFRNMQKFPWQQPIIFKVQQSICFNQLLTGYDKNLDKICLYRFMVMKNPRDVEDFSLKLDMCVGGKEWITLIRYDAIGEPHPQFIDANGNFVEHGYLVELPHFHSATHAGQLLYHDNLQTMYAKFADRISKQLRKGELSGEKHFKIALDYFKNCCAIASKIESYDISETSSIFSYDDICYEQNIDDLKFNHILNLEQKGEKIYEN